MVLRKSIKDSMISLPVEHDQIAKWGLKDKARFKSFLEFGLSPEKFKSIDFSRWNLLIQKYYKRRSVEDFECVMQM